AAAPVTGALDHPAPGVHRERVALGVAVLAQPLGEDAQAVARLLGLAAVGVEDAQAEIGAGGGHQHQNAVGADPPVPVADADDGGLREIERQVVAAQDDVVVAEAVALGERDRRHGARAQRCDIGTYVARVGPVYSARGRISRLLPCCSSTWAAHPATRLIAKIGVNWSVGMPIAA